MEASIIISNKNRIELLKKCLLSIEKYTKDVKYELYIIDVGSTDGSREYLTSLWENGKLDANLIYEDIYSTYAESNNRIMRACRTPYIYLLNNDCEARPGWLRKAIDFAESDKKIGHVASLVLWGNGLIQSAGANLLKNGNSKSCLFKKPENCEEAKKIRNVAYAGLGLYRKDLLEKLGYMPEYPSKIYWSDTGWGMKVWNSGHEVRYCPFSKVVHLLHPTERRGHSDDILAGKVEFMKDWGEFLKENNGFSPEYPYSWSKDNE